MPIPVVLESALDTQCHLKFQKQEGSGTLQNVDKLMLR